MGLKGITKEFVGFTVFLGASCWWPQFYAEF